MFAALTSEAWGVSRQQSQIERDACQLLLFEGCPLCPSVNSEGACVYVTSCFTFHKLELAASRSPLSSSGSLEFRLQTIAVQGNCTPHGWRKPLRKPQKLWTSLYSKDVAETGVMGGC